MAALVVVVLCAGALVRTVPGAQQARSYQNLSAFFAYVLVSIAALALAVVALAYPEPFLAAGRAVMRLYTGSNS